MALSAADILVAAQSPSNPNHNVAAARLLPFFGRLLSSLAARECLRRGIPLSNVEDIVQDTLSRVLIYDNRFDPTRSVEGYLRSLVATSAAKRKRYCKRATPRPAPEEAGNCPATYGEATSPKGGELGFVTDEVAAKVLALLEPKEKVAVIRVYMGNETPKAVAADFGVDPTTVRRLLARAKKRVLAAMPEYSAA